MSEHCITVEELSIRSLLRAHTDGMASADSMRFGEKNRVLTLSVNPFLKSDEEPGRVVVSVDGQTGSAKYMFPLWVKADGHILKTCTGSGTYTKEEFRKYALGVEIFARGMNECESRMCIAAGNSQQALQILRRMHYVIFEMPRLVAVSNPRSVVERYCRLKLVSRIVSNLGRIALRCMWTVVGRQARKHLTQYRIEELSAADEHAISAVASLADRDGHSFAEVHNGDWFAWHMRYSFSDQGPARLFVLKDVETIVGFWMTKERFHGNASVRGFRDVWLGSVIEWGAASGHEEATRWAMLSGIVDLFRCGMDAVEVCTDDHVLIRWFRRHGWMRIVGAGNFAIKAKKDSPIRKCAGWSEQSNWRLRPAMGDNGLS